MIPIRTTQYPPIIHRRIASLSASFVCLMIEWYLTLPDLRVPKPTGDSTPH